MLSLHKYTIEYLIFSDTLFLLVSGYFFIQLTTSAIFSLHDVNFNKFIFINNYKSNFFLFFLFFLLFFYKFYWNLQLPINTYYNTFFFYNQMFSDVLILLALMVSTISWVYLSERYITQNIFINNYLIIFLFCSLNMVYTNNLLTMFIFFEFIFIPSIFFAYKLSYVKKAQKTVEFLLIWTLTGTLISLMTFSILFYISGIVSIPLLNQVKLSAIEINILFFFFFIGFGVKIPVWPLYFWLTKVHVETPTGFSMFLSGFLVKTAFFCFSQVFFLFNTQYMKYFCISLIVWGILDSSFRMWSNVDIKKLIALATVQEMNMILLLLFLLTNSNFLILNLFLLVHGVLSIFFFFLVELTYKLYQTRNLLNVHGAQIINKLHFLIWIGLLTYRGFPFFIKFLIEWEFFSVLWVQFATFGFYLFLLISFFGVVGFCKNWFLILYGFSNINVSIQLITHKDFSVGCLLTGILFFLNTSVYLFI